MKTFSELDVDSIVRMLDRERAKHYAKIFKVFANPSRLLILWTLMNGEVCVGDIALEIGASVQNTSQHLRLMRDRNILGSRREGQTIYYYVHDDDLINAIQALDSLEINTRTHSIRSVSKTS